MTAPPAAGLRGYVAAVAGALGLSVAGAHHEVTDTTTAYIALTEHSPTLPDRDLMLTWTDIVGWTLAIEPGRPGQARWCWLGWSETRCRQRPWSRGSWTRYWRAGPSTRHRRLVPAHWPSASPATSATTATSRPATVCVPKTPSTQVKAPTPVLIARDGPGSLAYTVSQSSDPLVCRPGSTAGSKWGANMCAERP
ncbi:MAG TPA: DUF6292 family protein [Pseudonocardiaceae bacterium]|nr:DUF6292 family protein [Pseudonocardiaceae bacterium]